MIEYYLALKTNELSSHENTWRSLKCISLSERSQPEKTTYWMIPTIWHYGKRKIRETVKRSVVAMALWGGSNELAACRFLGEWNYPLWCYNCRYMLLQICPNPQNKTPGVNSNINYGLWKINEALKHFHKSQQTSHSGGDVYNEGYVWDMYVWGQGAYRKSLYLLLNTSINLKLL